MSRSVLRVAAVMLVASLLAGCDKCGHPMKLLTPSVPKACGDNADPNHG